MADITIRNPAVVAGAPRTERIQALALIGSAARVLLKGDAVGASEALQHLFRDLRAAEYFDPEQLGILALGAGKLDDAVKYLRLARERKSHLRPYHGWVCYELALTLLERANRAGETPPAETHALLEEAEGSARALDMKHLEARVSAALAGLSPAAAARPAGLSEREVEVLRLIAQGKTNKEIAFALFIAEKTVHNHVSNILAKIGITNRVEAAAFALRQGLT